LWVGLTGTDDAPVPVSADCAMNEKTPLSFWEDVVEDVVDFACSDGGATKATTMLFMLSTMESCAKMEMAAATRHVARIVNRVFLVTPLTVSRVGELLLNAIKIIMSVRPAACCCVCVCIFFFRCCSISRRPVRPFSLILCDFEGQSLSLSSITLLLGSLQSSRLVVQVA
jgi:hypothetical protein